MFSGLLINTSNAEISNEVIPEPIFSDSLVNDTTIKVKKSKYIERRNIIMSTIGKSNYLDGNFPTNYSITNNYIRNEFPELLSLLLNFFKNKFNGDNVMYLADTDNNKYSLPGFHIFDCNYISTFQVASVHKDLQYLKLPGTFDIDLKNTLSFTICFEAQEGPHLYVFDDSGTPNNVNYLPGHIVCHDGHHFHMIAPNKRIDNSVKRITMQGHIIYDKITKMYYIYW